ncbi:MAG: endolytic transglycosylase MltG, partial [Caldimonas sp.]
RGDQTLAAVRFTEGWTFRQIRAELARAESLKPTTAALSDAEVMAALGAPGVSPEGRLHPDTYLYSKGSNDLAVLKRAFRAMDRQLAQVWQERDPATPLRSAEEALTLASIVEKETGTAADRGRVAGVFVNRLRLGMPLQTDPTVIYGLGVAFDGNLRKRDLLADGPYNTYTRTGLPPTPIAVPGKASLLAAVRPEATKALYFVARGDGSSEFSETLADHNRAVNRFQRKNAP